MASHLISPALVTLVLLVVPPQTDGRRMLSAVQSGLSQTDPSSLAHRMQNGTIANNSLLEGQKKTQRQNGSSWMNRTIAEVTHASSAQSRERFNTTQSLDDELRQNILFAGDGHGDGLSKAETLHQKFTSSMVMVVLLCLLGTMHATHSSDELVRQNSWKLINTILAIICALFIVDGQHMLWTMILHDTFGVQADIADLLTVVLFVGWYLGITVACHKYGEEDHLFLHVWVEGIITHVAAFTVIELVHHPIEHFGHTVHHDYPGSAMAMFVYKLVWVVGVWALFGVFSCVSQQMRVRWNFSESLREVCEECEADASAIAAGYCYMHFIWSLVQPGIATPADCVKPFCSASRETRNLTFLMWLGMCVAVVYYNIGVSKRVGEHVGKYALYIETHLAMLIGWTGYLIVAFSMGTLPQQTEEIWNSPISRKFLAFIWCSAAWVFIASLVGYAHKFNIAHKDSFAQLLKALSLVLAVCLEKVYGKAVSVISVGWSEFACRVLGLHYVPSMKLVMNVLIWCFMFAMMIPAWKWYVAPHLLPDHTHGHEEHKVDDDHHMHEEQAPNKEVVT